ncbi:MAG TPA: ABC transporter substrate-binding protein, partial [Tepidisphaeraceae bacterium]|nr:ABC transporter substrate-binding protein [Tepidisphaeraceae bacterium]
ARAQNEIVIGQFAPMTGSTAAFGVATDDGVQLAVDEINAAGGVLGRPVKVVTVDDRSDPAEAVTAVQKLINQDKVVAIIGEVASTRSLAAAPVAQRARVPMLTPASTNPKVTQVGNYIFRSCFIDPFQGKAIANYAIGTKGLKRFAVLYDVKNDYSIGLRDAFVAAAKDKGGEVIADESYGEGDRDFRAQLTKIKATNPDAVFVPGYYTEVGLIIKQAREVGVTVPLMGGDGWEGEQTFQIAGAAADGCFYTNHYSPEEQRPAVQKFVAAYKQKFDGKTPNAWAILGYDAMHLMADAINRAGGTKGSDVRKALAETTGFPGASGTITMDENRNARKPIVVLEVRGGEPRYVASVEP